MSRFDDMFSVAERERIEADRKVTPEPQADHGAEMIALPDCYCCAVPECEHETMIQCEFCGVMYAPNTGHTCDQCGEPEAPQKDNLKSLARLRRIERVAMLACKEYADFGDTDRFGDIMVDLARESVMSQ